MKNNLGFAKRLSTLRADRGLSKSGLARAVGVSTTCVWNWEEGNTYPRPEALARIATALGTTAARLGRGEASSSDDREYIASENRRDETGLLDSKLAETVQAARSQIAAMAGLKVDQVRIILEYGN